MLYEIYMKNAVSCCAGWEVSWIRNPKQEKRSTAPSFPDFTRASMKRKIFSTGWFSIYL
jgi:hypothetical protein